MSLPIKDQPGPLDLILRMLSLPVQREGSDKRLVQPSVADDHNQRRGPTERVETTKRVLRLALHRGLVTAPEVDNPPVRGSCLDRHPAVGQIPHVDKHGPALMKPEQVGGRLRPEGETIAQAAVLAQRGHFGFGMPVIYHSHSPKPAVEARFDAQYRSLEQLLQEADFICLTLPLTAETEGLIGREQFALMRPESIFINISRGKVVDEAALIHALQNGLIRAAGLDVFEREPLDTASPLLTLDNVVATPHIGSATIETREAMARCAVDNLLAALAGERPPNLVGAFHQSKTEMHGLKEIS